MHPSRPLPLHSPTQPGAASTSHNAPRPSPARPLLPGCLARSPAFLPAVPGKVDFHQPFSFPRLSPLRPRSLTGSSTGRTGSGPLPSMLCGAAPLPSPLRPISRLPHAPGTTTPSSLPAIMAARGAPGAPPPAVSTHPQPRPPVCARNPCGANLGLSGARRRASKCGIRRGDSRGEWGRGSVARAGAGAGAGGGGRPERLSPVNWAGSRG